VYKIIYIDIDTSVNWNWVDTQWQQYSTYLHTNKYIEQYN